MFITLKNPSGILIQAKVGFSWTMLFFGMFVPFLRGDIKWFLTSLLLGFLSWGFSWFVFPFFYNSIYIKERLAEGYSPANKESRKILKQYGFIE